MPAPFLRHLLEILSPSAPPEPAPHVAPGLSTSLKFTHNASLMSFSSSDPSLKFYRSNVRISYINE